MYNITCFLDVRVVFLFIFVFLFVNFSVCFVPAVNCYDICCMSLHNGVYYYLFLLNCSLFEHVHVITLIILRCWLTLVTLLVFRWHLVMATKCFCNTFIYFVLLDFSCLGRRQKKINQSIIQNCRT